MVEQCLVAHVNSKGMGSRHHLTKASQVIHTVTTTDGIMQQKQVPIRALISLEQAPENSIRRLTKQEAMMVLLNQVMMPMWDDAAMALLTPLMGQLATEIPFYHLKNLPNREATDLTRKVLHLCHLQLVFRKSYKMPLLLLKQKTSYKI